MDSSRNRKFLLRLETLARERTSVLELFKAKDSEHLSAQSWEVFNSADSRLEQSLPTLLLLKQDKPFMWILTMILNALLHITELIAKLRIQPMLVTHQVLAIRQFASRVKSFTEI